jgi:hypothetical protein
MAIITHRDGTMSAYVDGDYVGTIRKVAGGYEAAGEVHSDVISAAWALARK